MLLASPFQPPILHSRQMMEVFAVALSLLDKRYAGFLFDMDGTILRSAASAERVWGTWAENHGLDPVKFLPTMHGSRGIDVIRRLNLPGIDPEAEDAKITAAEMEDLDGIEPIPGAGEFLAALPLDRWAIVTSSVKALALRRLEAAGLPRPRFMVTGEEVTAGKPDPQCYLVGADKLGIQASRCLVFEDVTAGVQAGEAAGADVLVVTSNQGKTEFAGRSTISNYTKITASLDDHGQLFLSPKF